MAAYKTKGKTFLQKIQAVADTPETPDGSNAIKTMELEYTAYSGDTQSLDYDSNGQGANPVINVNPTDEYSFKTSAFASGAAGTAPPVGVCLRLAGMSEAIVPATSVSYTTIDVTTDPTEFGTCFHIRGNMRYQCSDAMQDMGFEIKAGQFAMFDFGGGMGKYITPEEQVAVITPVYTDWKDPLPMTKANTPTTTIGVYQGCVDQIKFSMGNNIVKHDRSGCAGVSITSRSPSLTMVLEAPDITSKNFFSEAESHTGTVNLYDVTVQHGTTAGSIIGAVFEDCQIKSIKEVDLNGNLGFELELIPTSDNPLTLTLT